MRDARVLRVRDEQWLEERCSTHVGFHIAPFVRRSEQRQRIKRRPIDIVGICGVKSFHLLGVRCIPRVLVAFAVKDFYRVHVRFLTRRRRLCLALIGGVCKPLQRLTRRRDVLFKPDRVVVGHRFPPGRKRERGIGGLGFLEPLRRVGILEVVELREAGQK